MARPRKSSAPDDLDRQLLIQPPEAPVPEGAEVIFRPASKPQELALTTPADEILTGGAKAGGKSFVGRAFILKGNPEADPNGHPANVSYVLHPDYTALVLRRTYKEMLDWVLKAQQFFCNPKFPKQFRARWVAEPKFFEWPSGARAYVGHLRDSDSANLQKGWAVLHRILIEELTESIEDPNEYFQLLSCMRSLTTTPELKCQVMATTNFDGKGLEWVKGYWLYNPATGERHPDGEIMKVAVKSPRGEVREMTRIFIPFRLVDNPHISPEYEFNLSRLPEHMRQVYLEGNPEGLNGSMFFPEFRTEQKENEPVGAVHVVDNSELFWETWEPMLAGYDWGYSHKAVMLIGTEKKTGPYRGKFIIREEKVWRKVTDVQMGEDMARAILPYLNEHRRVMVVHIPPELFAKWIESSPMESVVGRLKEGVDRILGKDATKVLPGEDFLKQLKYQVQMKVIFRPAENRRVHGWGIMRQMLDWSGLKEDRPKYDPEYALRLSGERPDLFLQYAAKMKELEDNSLAIPRLMMVKNATPELIGGIRRAVFDKDGDVLKRDCDINTGVGGDDAIDACRYLLVGVHRTHAKEPEEVWLQKQLDTWREHLQPRTFEEDLALKVKIQRDRERAKQSHGNGGRLRWGRGRG